MKKTTTILTLMVLSVSSAFAQYQTISTDPSGDSNGFNDVTKLEYKYDNTTDSLWFRFTLATIPSGTDLGVNVMVNIPGASDSFNFWGDDNTNAYHRFVTAWVTGTPPSNYSGVIGIADGSGVQSSNYVNLQNNNLNIVVSTAGNTIELGMKGLNLIPSSARNQSISTAGAVGHSAGYEDDIYTSTGSIELTTTTAGIKSENATSTAIQIFPNPANDKINIATQNLNEGDVMYFIYDITGKEVYRSSLVVDKSIDISSFNSGVYYVKMKTSNGGFIGSKKFVKF
ncbi:MAG: hypothetical protein COA58_13260 [Bacteroidetes bacterium]|nr:MAG: hypothetical protein COA58_13260 [Bacteroidota bacterium]